MASIKHSAILSTEPLTVWHLLWQFSDILHGNAELSVIKPEKSKMLRFPTTDYADSVERLLMERTLHPAPLSHQ